MASEPSGASYVVAAIILGLSILTGSYLIKTSLDDAAQQLAATASQLQENAAKLAAARPSPTPPPSRPSRPSRPDPSRRYEVAIGNAHTKGPANAAVKIVEWSDFQ